MPERGLALGQEAAPGQWAAALPWPQDGCLSCFGQDACSCGQDWPWLQDGCLPCDGQDACSCGQGWLWPRDGCSLCGDLNACSCGQAQQSRVAGQGAYCPDGLPGARRPWAGGADKLSPAGADGVAAAPPFAAAAPAALAPLCAVLYWPCAIAPLPRGADICGPRILDPWRLDPPGL